MGGKKINIHQFLFLHIQNEKGHNFIKIRRGQQKQIHRGTLNQSKVQFLPRMDRQNKTNYIRDGMLVSLVTWQVERSQVNHSRMLVAALPISNQEENLYNTKGSYKKMKSYPESPSSTNKGARLTK